MRRTGISLFIAAVLAFTLAETAVSQLPPSGGGTPEAALQPIASIEFEGLTSVDSGRVARTLRIEAGDPVSAPEWREALLRLWRLQVFNDIWVTGRLGTGGVEATVHLVERPRVAAIEMIGVEEFDPEELQEKSNLSVGTRLSPLALAAAEDSILQEYREQGYVQATVAARTEPTGPNQALVTVEVFEGHQARITDFAFPGATSFSKDELKDKLESKGKGFLRSGKVDPEKLAKDAQNLREFYRNNGYRDVFVHRDSMRFSEDGKEITLVYRIEEGPLYRFGEISWVGQQSIDNRQLSLLPTPRAGSYYSEAEIRKSIEAAYSHYAEMGFLYVNVAPNEEVLEDNTVDVEFQIAEKAPSKLRQIHITGNTYTKEKVIRRELSIREGDRFSRTLLMRSQQNIFRLGFFEDVQVDFRPAYNHPDSTDVDLYLNVKEKRSGTASAGAGFSSESGLTGFLQLGHNNLFGNGQSVNVQLERGSRRNTINLSFTDPWFLDSRTTFGFSIFNRERQTEVFSDLSTDETLEIREVRRGGSLRLGRPLSFIDFARGFVTYRIENVRQSVDNESGQLTDAQLALAENIITIPQTTSSITLSILRDSRNHPFYPTGGSNIRYSSEFAGKMLGGNVHFNKHELDGRFYFPSVLRGVGTMIRYRAGILAGYGDSRTVPDWERFRLGGTTFYGLRGYQDFEIVPEQNIRIVVDSTGAVSEVRYPGGRWYNIMTFEQQFPIVNPLRGLLFAEGGNTWNGVEQIQPFDLFKSAGFGFRLEIPLLGNLGLDFGYGFDRRDPGWRTHFLLGNMLF